MDDHLLLAEEFLLLALDDEKGTSRLWYGADPALAGALLLDLAAAGAVGVTDGKLVATPGARLEHPLLTDAHRGIARSDKPRDARGWLGQLARQLKPLGDRIGDSLAGRGVLRREDGKVMGLFTRTRFPAAHGGAEADLRARLGAVLRSERQPTPREAQLVALLLPYDQAGKLVDREHRKAARARAKEIADRGIAGQAVSDAVQAEVMTIVLTATIAASAAAGAGGS